MKTSIYRRLPLLIAYLCILGCNSKSGNTSHHSSSDLSIGDTVASITKNQTGTVSISIRLKKPVDTFRVNVAPLKYNKSFAFSFTLDDGLVSDYLVAYPFFTGGKVSGHYYYSLMHDQGADGLEYPGLFYTDGCGNKIPFKAGIAINAKGISILGIIFPHGHLTWKEVKALYEAGWDVLNHSYSHATGKNIHVKYEVGENNQEVNEHLGFQMKDFVIPGGPGDSVSNSLYTKTAFADNMETVQSEDFGNYLIQIDSRLNLDHLRLGRLFMRSTMDTVNGKPQDILQLRSGNNPDFDKPAVRDAVILFDRIDTLVYKKKNFWINAFTHSVGNQNLWNIGMIFPEFRSFFNQLESRYGQQGADNMWMAPTQEVYEYLLNKKAVKYKTKMDGNIITVSINKSSMPENARYHELTFLLDVHGDIQSVKCDGCHVESYTDNKKLSMINITGL